MHKIIFVFMVLLLLTPVMFADIVELSPDCNVSKDIGITPPTIQELKWDDGAHCGYYYGPNMYRATTFTAPYDLLIVSMKIFWYNCTNVNTVELDIYSDDGGYPDEGLFSEPVEDNIPVGG